MSAVYTWSATVHAEGWGAAAVARSQRHRGVTVTREEAAETGRIQEDASEGFVDYYGVAREFRVGSLLASDSVVVIGIVEVVAVFILVLLLLVLAGVIGVS